MAQRKGQPEGRRGKAAALLLSIRPQHAYRIFEGSKHFELRKFLPTARFERVFLYETGGAGIVGWFDASEVIRRPINELWKRVGTAATTRDAFFSYFAHSSQGFAIEVREPHRFRHPVNATRLNGNRLKLLPPQSFSVLEPGQPLYMLLEAERRVTLRGDLPRIELRRIKRPQRKAYEKLVLRHISRHYQGIDETFARANLKIHDLGFDPAGFFTKKKEVLAVYDPMSKCIGFTTLTYKSGGCVKTGPTLLLDRYRGRGYGQATRRAIEERVREAGARKIYCTCPESAVDTVRYLLASGMRVEAHLECHYAATHDELVFGKLVVSDENSVPPVATLKLLKGEIVDPVAFQRQGLVGDIKVMFGKTWSPVSSRFVEALLSQAIEQRATRHHEKPKRLVCLRTGRSCVGAIVLLPKRGGAVKGLLLRATSHEASLRKLLQAALAEVIRLNGRKLYFLHPAADASAVVFMKSNGFRAEGLLRAPYVPGQDVVVMSRFV